MADYEKLKRDILEDGIIDKEETQKIRELIFADGVIDEEEKQFLIDLKQNAKSVCPEFEALFKECINP